MSKYIRMKHSDEFGFCSCVTCGLTKHFSQMQAGHFIARAQGNACYFEEPNINCQCYRCNVNLGGNGAEYYPYMVKTYGQDEIDRLRALSNTTLKFTKNDLLNMEKELKEKVKIEQARLCL